MSRSRRAVSSRRPVPLAAAFAVATLLTLPCAGAERAAPAAGALPADLDAFVARTLKTFEVPGVGVAVVKDGKVVLAKGYGVKRVGASEPVGPGTLFPIGSNTKAFTTASLAMLVDEGKLSWDDRVVDLLPGFQMYDPYVTSEMRVRDLLCHRSGLGLGAGDLLIFPESDYTRAEIVRRIRYLKPVTSFRSAYAYDNLLYLVAGQVLEAVSGKTWEAFVKERILGPVGMRSSATSWSAAPKDADGATLHARQDGVLRPVRRESLDNVAPAGAIVSSAADMARWVVVQLDRGALSSLRPGATERLFGADRSREMWSPNTILPNSEPPAAIAATKSSFASYGLGWGLREYRGRLVASHTGGVLGAVSRVVLLPEQRLGVVVLSNQEEGGATAAIALHVLDSYLGVSDTDWIAANDQLRAQRVADEAKALREASAARAGTKPSLPLEGYAGTYRDPWRDDVTIANENGKLVMRFSRTAHLVGDLEHWQHDTFIARWRERELQADAYVTFALEPDGSIRDVRMRPVSPLTDFSFDFQDLLLTRAPKK